MKTTDKTKPRGIEASRHDGSSTEVMELRARVEKYEQLLLSTRLIMGHEIKRPTTAISGYLDLLLEDASAQSSPDMLENVQKACEECRLLNELNALFLELLAADGYGDAMIGESVEVSALIDEVLDVAGPRNAKQRTTVSIGHDAGEFRVNRYAFKAVLVNLVENALRHSPSDTPVSISVARPKDDRALLNVEVVDSGCGIQPEDRERVFRPFVRLGGEHAEGSGLGLSLARALTELHGGRISIDTNDGGGTKVVVAIPEGADEPNHRLVP